jgi:putative zinc finger/helix-turn-helix YgiT family protein
MKRLCPECGKTSEWEMITRPEEFEIKGEIITVENQVLICPECKAEYEDMNSEIDPFNLAYEEYRRRKGMVHPAQIVAFRKKYDLTQKELSELLGFGGVTLSRYENGSLQDEAHDQLLRFILQPNNLLNLVKQKPDTLSETKRKQLLAVLEKEITTGSLLRDLLKNNIADIYTGYKPFDLNKVVSLIRFFTFPKRVYKSKLLKLLFYADFKAFKESGIAMTGMKYARLPYGPVPDKFTFLLASVPELDPAISLEVDPMGDLYLSSAPPDPMAFEPQEWDMLRKIQACFKDSTSKAIEDFSHEEKGYKETRKSELISYEYAKDLQI